MINKYTFSVFCFCIFFINIVMYFKANTNFDLENKSTIYMEAFCRALHPDLDLSTTCLSWFRQATEHCTALVLRTKQTDSKFWRAVKSFIFSETETGLLNQKIPINIHPNRLSLQDCHAFFVDIVNDYLQHAPRYATTAATNMLLWQILYSLMGIVALGSLLVSTMVSYRKFGRLFHKTEKIDPFFAPEKRAVAYVNHNMRVAKYELQRLHVRHLLQPEEILAPDGTTILVMKVSSKLSLFEGIIRNDVQTAGRLYRLHELANKKKSEKSEKPDYKTETVTKVMKFLNNYSRKLRLLLVFDEDPFYEQLLRKGKSKTPTYIRDSPRLSLQMRNSPKRALSPAAAKSSQVMSARSIGSTRSTSPIKSRKVKQLTQIPRNLGHFNSSFSLKKRAA